MEKQTKLVLGIGLVIGIISLAFIFAGSSISNTENVEIERYSVIPEMPSDFYAYRREVFGGGFTTLCDLDENYWKQPYFYGDSWTISKEKFYDNPNYQLWGVYGQGNIPREISYSFTDLKKGDEFEFCTFFRNGFGVWTYQGFKLVPYGGNEYFDVVITPNEFVLAPTFPVFEEDWLRRITVTLKVKETPPRGKYVIGFNVVQPSNKFSIEANKKVLQIQTPKEKYLQDCIRFLDDEKRCEYLINLREKKYVEGGTYQPAQPPLVAEIIIL